MNQTEGMLQSIRNNFFLQKHRPLPSTMKLLADLYPTIDWSRVDFYEGLPWFTPIIAPYVTAQALPQFYSFSRYRIYLRKFDESRAQCLADIVHEGMHVFQAMHFFRGYGFGILRGFTVLYSAVFARHGYRNNNFEIPAYDQEFGFLKYCEEKHQHGIVPKIDTSVLTGISSRSSLVIHKFKFHYNANFILLAGGFIFCLIFAILKPVIDVFVFLIIQFVPVRTAHSHG
ncbi:MAG TPA: hypothetical protein VI731_06540 [Bacteroidia bacterium]|nr:hypothetical protein [Bacteroidia bacterium]